MMQRHMQQRSTEQNDANIDIVSQLVFDGLCRLHHADAAGELIIEQHRRGAFGGAHKITQSHVVSISVDVNIAGLEAFQFGAASIDVEINQGVFSVTHGQR